MRMPIEIGSEEGKGRIASRMEAGRWVKTMVRMLPILRAKLAEIRLNAAEARPVQKNKVPRAPSLIWNL